MSSHECACNKREENVNAQAKAPESEDSSNHSRGVRDRDEEEPVGYRQCDCHPKLRSVAPPLRLYCNSS
jgi:hypothetical protein